MRFPHEYKFFAAVSRFFMWDHSKPRRRPCPRLLLLPQGGCSLRLDLLLRKRLRASEWLVRLTLSGIDLYLERSRPSSRSLPVPRPDPPVDSLQRPAPHVEKLVVAVARLRSWVLDRAQLGRRYELPLPDVSGGARVSRGGLRRHEGGSGNGRGHRSGSGKVGPPPRGWGRGS